MKTKKETNKKELSFEEFIQKINSGKHNRTWAAAIKSQGCLIVTDPNLM